MSKFDDLFRDPPAGDDDGGKEMMRKARAEMARTGAPHFMCTVSWVSHMAQIISEAIDKRVAERDRRIEKLEATVKRIEKDGAGHVYRGVYSPGSVYERNESVTHAGAMWVCVRAQTDARPGESNAWQLAVKRGATVQ